MSQRNRQSFVIAAALLTALVSASPAAAVLQGDCNDNGVTAINEVQRCANIFLDTQDLSLCPPCDQNGNGTVAINEVAGASNCFLDSTSAGCRMVVGGPTPTNTAVAATNTPTNTAGATATFTSSPVNTPTNTAPLPTSTPTPVEPPTGTPTATTPPSSSVRLSVDILPGGGTPRNCRGTCTGGLRDGLSCGTNSDCWRACVGGSNAGNFCTNNAGCPSGTCPTTTCGGTRTCGGGPLDGMTCTGGSSCNGCTQASGPEGSCAVVQLGIFPINLPLNGVCLPRTLVPDAACVTDDECKTCVGGSGNGNACLVPTDCPAPGTCSGAGNCAAPGLDMLVGSPDPVTGEAPLTIPDGSLRLSPAFVSGIGNVCVTGAGEGRGAIDCDGGRPNLNTSIEADHDTKPGSPTNSGPTVGLPDDPGCNADFVLPDGNVDRACLEGTGTCSGGTNAGMFCMNHASCPMGRCSFCNTGGAPDGICLSGVNQDMACNMGSQCPPPAPTPTPGSCTTTGAHPGLCNSPNVVTQTGVFAAGDMVVAFPLAIQILPDASVLGPDGLPCTADDKGDPPAAVSVVLSTGTNESTIYDYNPNPMAPNPGQILGPGRTCGGSPCLSSVTGAPAQSCQALSAGSVAGITFGGTFPAMDVSVGDITTAFLFTLGEARVVEEP